MMTFNTDEITIDLLDILCKLGLGFNYDFAIVDQRHRKAYVFGEDDAFMTKTSPFKSLLKRLTM